MSQFMLSMKAVGQILIIRFCLMEVKKSVPRFSDVRALTTDC